MRKKNICWTQREWTPPPSILQEPCLKDAPIIAYIPIFPVRCNRLINA